MRVAELSGGQAQALLRHLPQIVWIARADGYRTYYNAHAQAYFQRPLAELTGWAWVNLVHPGDASRVLSEWAASIRSSEGHEIECRLRSADGTYRWNVCLATPLRDLAGRVISWVGSCLDIDDRIQRVDALRHACGEMRHTLAVLDQLQSRTEIGFSFVDKELRYLRVNPTMAGFAGLPVAEYIGRKVPEVLSWAWETLEPIYLKVFATKKPLVDISVHASTPAEPAVQRRWIASYYPILCETEFLGIAVVAKETTEFDHLERRLGEISGS